MKTHTVRTPLDVLALPPIMLGFEPKNSVVIIVTEAAGGAPSMRVDMPRSLDDCDEIAANIRPVTDREGVCTALLLLYTEDAQVTEYADRLVSLFPTVTFPVTMHVTPTHYRSLRGIGPTEETPYDLSTHPMIAEAVLEGQVMLQDRSDIAKSLIGTVTPGVASAYRQHVELARAQFKLLGHPTHDPLAVKRFLKGEALWVKVALRRCRDTGEMLTDPEVGRMAAALVPIEVRDVAWAQITAETAPFFKEFFRNLTQRVPSETAAAPATLFGFTSWVTGDGASAWIGVERAREAEPDYSMAALLTQALTNGMPPHLWQPLPEGDLAVWDVA